MLAIEIAQINRDHEKKDNYQFDRYKKIHSKQQNIVYFNNL